METIKRYWMVIVATAITVFVYLFRRRGARIETLEAQIEMNEITSDIKQKEKEYQDAKDKAETSGRAYDDLLDANRELADKLGLGAGANQSNPRRDAQNN